MRFILIFLFLISHKVLACIPCDKEIGLNVAYQAIPKFDQAFGAGESAGEVTFKVDTDHRGVISNINIVDLYPSDLPRKPILEMIKNSKFVLLKPRKGYSQCGVEGYQLVMEFVLPQKIKLDI